LSLLEVSSIYYFALNKQAKTFESLSEKALSASTPIKGLALKSDTLPYFGVKGNAVKDQHRNDKPPIQRLFRCKTTKAPSALAAFKLNFYPYRVADAKNLISQDGRTTRRGAYQSQQGMIKNEPRKNSAKKSKYIHRTNRNMPTLGRDKK